MDPATEARISTSGTTVDCTGAPPFGFEFHDDWLFGWMLRDRHVVWEAGNPPSEREQFELSLMYVASAQEQASARRQRSVTVALDEKAHAYLERVAANTAPLSDSGLPWSELSGEVTPDAVRGFNVRAVGLRLTGWRYRSS